MRLFEIIKDKVLSFQTLPILLLIFYLNFTEFHLIKYLYLDSLESMCSEVLTNHRTNFLIKELNIS